MTSGSRSDPEKSSEESEARSASEQRAGSEATREQGDSRDSEDAEPSETATAASDTRTGSDATREGSGSRSDSRDSEDDIPLNIAGHEDREARSASGDSDGLFGSDDESDDPAAALEDAGVPVSENGHDEGDVSVSENGHDEGADIAPGEDAVSDDASAAEDDEDVEPVEVLVGLAEEGAIDPWDIDIVAVTDKFLERLDERDLRTSGRALFYASVLLRMKGDAMLADDDEEEDEEPWDQPWEQGMDEEPVGGPDPFAALESEMDRRLERRRARGMPQTLDELVRDLREAERDNWWKESREYDTSESPAGFQRGTQQLDYHSGDDLRMDDEPTAAEVTGKTHNEDIETVIGDVHGALREQYDKGREEVLYREIEGSGGSRVQTFLGLLFLAHRGQVRLAQDDLFGDMWIQDPNAATGSEEAVAD